MDRTMHWLLDQQLCRSPNGHIHVGLSSSNRRLLRPNGQPVFPTNGCLEPVLINVYDLHWTNRMTKRLRLAAYHTGLEVYGVEIAYGDCGVYRIKPKDVNSMECDMVFKKSVQLGCTDYKREDVLLISQWLGQTLFTGRMYDLLRRNCNHFSATMGKLLCPQAEFPKWINSLASIGVRLPFIERRVRRYLSECSDDEDGDEAGKKAGNESTNATTIEEEKGNKRRGLREICANLSRCSSSGQQQGNADRVECDKKQSK
ncbi:hypothetical protein BOX15_Mlig032727g1 [Macrostomum lignano]|uniref:PPPDE domain-containing protein n=1 Tax=Macrostomum lignano TaxID=282301 RepID=A0A267EM73_9PLAT|nr:hypothetical protein BOX15_Mlig032727g3 [Macrostomum lignano]PAA61872.1 hypothetical protein BOX15_Mlig032727g1 [Macrostomum lignano]